MTIVATLKKIFEQFDRQPFIPVLENIVFNEIHSFVSKLKKDFSSEEMAELIAFRFLERNNKGNNEWDTFYQPLSSATKEDGSKTTCLHWNLLPLKY